MHKALAAALLTGSGTVVVQADITGNHGRDKEPEAPAVEEDPPEVYGPRRRPPQYYVGESVGARRVGQNMVAPKRVLHADVERNPNGSVPGIRNKAARRMIRKKLKARFSKVERSVDRTHELKREVAQLGNNSHDRARIYDKMLALHGEVPEPVSNEVGNQIIAAAVDKNKP